jgi:hypothetical protein
VKRVSDADAQMRGGGSGWVELGWGATGQGPRKLREVTGPEDHANLLFARGGEMRCDWFLQRGMRLPCGSTTSSEAEEGVKKQKTHTPLFLWEGR